MRRVVLFVENFGHEEFLKALLDRLAHQCETQIEIIPRSVRGGHGKVMAELQEYLRDLEADNQELPDLLIVATDGNCKGHQERKQEIDKGVGDPFKDLIVYAIPDPHVERWLLLDSSAFKVVLGKGCAAPDYKGARMNTTRRLSRAIALLICVAVMATVPVSAQRKSPVPPLREQAEIQQQWLKLRLERVLPHLMRKHGVQMWLVICREYNEDPVFFSLVSPTMFAARRRTIYVFFDRGEEQGVERLALGGGSNGGLYTVYRDPELETRELYGEGQWVLLKKLVEERKPATIAVNISHTHAFADGLSAGEREKLETALGPEWIRRFVRAENLALEYVSIRLPEMLPAYKKMMQTVHDLIGRAFSNEVITPGKTANQDVVWWMRQEVNDLGLGTWFQPSVRVQKPGKAGVNLLAEDAPVVIERGDVLHVDFGITAMRLNTDTQHMGYVLREGERDVPAGIKRALANGNRLQDLLMERMRTGKSGNEALADTLAAMKAEGIKGSVYTHPIGDHGHGAGPLVGLWDRQQGVPGRGDVLILPNTWFSIELAATTPVPEWGGKELWVGQEEDAYIDEQGRISWVLKRQTEYHLVK